MEEGLSRPSEAAGRPEKIERGLPQKKWGPALLPAPTAPSEGSAGVRNLVKTRRPRPALDPGSPAQASLPIKQLPLARSPTDLLDCAARRIAGLSVRPAWPGPKTSAKTVRCSAALLGITSTASRFALHDPKIAREPRRATGRSPLPAPLPGWPRIQLPKSSQHCLPAEIGPLVTCRTRLAVAGSLGRPGPPSRSPSAPCTSRSESRKRKIWEEACG